MSSITGEETTVNLSPDSTVPRPKLCRICTELYDIHTFVPEDKEISNNGRTMLRLGRRSRKTTCDMCNFFKSLASNSDPTHDQEQQVRLFDHDCSALPKSKHLFLSVINTRSINPIDDIIPYGVILYVPRNSTAQPLDQTPVSVVNSNFIDFDLLRSWIERCQDGHVSCSQAKDQLRRLPYMYLIDCVEEKVVKADAAEIYFALSYVWGQQNQQRDVRKLSFPDETFSFDTAPLTVQDAVRVVRNLKKRYLWVDRYCIDQENETEKGDMIRNMDQIYENAEATIVAMYGEDDQAGLPGVSSVARISQPRFETPHGAFVSSFPPLRTLFQSAKWARRGWTYQEARLSRRCLFFTKQQVYFVCQDMSCSETMPLGSAASSFSQLMNRSRLDSGLFGEDMDLDQDGFCVERFYFTRRTLTNERDILDAFRGILSRSPLLTFWGVRIIVRGGKMDPHTSFALGLTWTSELLPGSKFTKAAQRVRRAGFPTWSWTSVTGAILQDGGQWVYKSDKSVSLQNDAEIHFCIRLGGQLIPLNQAIQLESNVLPEESPDLVVQGNTVRVRTSRNENGHIVYCVCGCEDLYELSSIGPRIDLDEDYAAQVRHIGQEEDALILLDRIDEEQFYKHKFFLMLLRWTEDDVAERKGLLISYRPLHNADDRKPIPRTRRKFVLR